MGKKIRFPALRHRKGGKVPGCRLEDGRVGESSPRPLGLDFRSPRRRVPGSPTQLWAPVKIKVPVAGSMEAPVEAEVENGDGDSSCGDLCFMDKGLRR